MTPQAYGAHRTLVGLDWHGDHFYLDGDAQRVPVQARPIGPPRVIEGMPFGTPYTKQIRMLASQAPEAVNAFVLGAPLPSLADAEREYSVVVQFYVIPDDQMERAAALQVLDWAIDSFVYEGGRLGWVKKIPSK